MVSAVTRELSISYGAYQVGGTSDSLLDGPVRVTQSFPTAVVEFGFVVTGASEIAFVQACARAERAFREPHQGLTIAQGDELLLSLQHESNTGFNAEPEIRKSDDIGDTGRSRVYRVRIEFGLPADTEDPSGLRESDIEVAYDPARRRTVRFSGIWTAISAKDSREQYEDEVASWATSILSALGGTYELIDESASVDKEDKLCSFSRVYRELIFPQGADSPTDDPEIVEQVLTISRRRSAPGDTPFASAAETEGVSVERFLELEVSYECYLDATLTTDLPGKWSSIRDWIFQRVQAIADGGAIAIVERKPEYVYDQNRIRATMSVIVEPKETTVVEHSVEVRDSLESGFVHVPAWTGQPFSRYRYEGPADLLRTISQRSIYLGFLAVSKAVDAALLIGSVFDQPNTNPLSGGSGGWDLVRREASPRKRRIGIDGKTIDVTEVVATTVWRYFEPLHGGTTRKGEVSPSSGSEFQNDAPQGGSTPSSRSDSPVPNLPRGG